MAQKIETMTRVEHEVAMLKRTVQSLMILVVVLIVIIGGYIAYKEFAPQKTPSAVAAPQAPQDPYEMVTSYPKPDNNKLRGSKDAEIVLIEYSDYQCPFCKRFHTTGEALMKKFGDKIAWVYRHYPLSFHDRALASGIAGECVYKLEGNDAFWKFTNEVFASSEDVATLLSDASLERLATAQGVNAGAFQTCVADPKVKETVEKEMKDGSGLGVSGTPGIFVVNTKTDKAVFVSGAAPQQTFEDAIEKTK